MGFITIKKSNLKFLRKDIPLIMGENNLELKRNICELLENIYAKKNKPVQRVTEAMADFSQKVFNLYRDQQEARELFIENLIDSLSEVMKNYEEHYAGMKENENKFLHLTIPFIKCIKEATIIIWRHLKRFVHHCVMEWINLSQPEYRNVDYIGANIENSNDKFAAEYNRKSWETIRQIYNTMNK